MNLEQYIRSFTYMHVHPRSYMCITRRPEVNLFYMSVVASTNVDRILGIMG